MLGRVIAPVDEVKITGTAERVLLGLDVGSSMIRRRSRLGAVGGRSGHGSVTRLAGAPKWSYHSL